VLPEAGEKHERTNFGEGSADALARAVTGQFGRELALGVASLPVGARSDQSAASLRVVAPRGLQAAAHKSVTAHKGSSGLSWWRALPLRLQGV